MSLVRLELRVDGELVGAGELPDAYLQSLIGGHANGGAVVRLEPVPPLVDVDRRLVEVRLLRSELGDDA